MPRVPGISDDKDRLLREWKKREEREAGITGLIPAYTECPFSSECVIHEEGLCTHKVENDTSCDQARGFRLIKLYSSKV